MRLTGERHATADTRRFVFEIAEAELTAVIGNDVDRYAGEIESRPISRQLVWLARLAEDVEYLDARRREASREQA